MPSVTNTKQIATTFYDNKCFQNIFTVNILSAVQNMGNEDSILKGVKKYNPYHVDMP